jgi:predicted phage terminase large subunit-like protein
MQRKAELGDYWWSAMYQQQPQPLEGGILKRAWLNYYDKMPGSSSNGVTYTGWDLAISTKETADYTCSCTLKVDNNTGQIYILDWTREHIDFPTQQKMVPSVQQKHQAALIGIEDVSYQAALPQSLRGLRLPIKQVHPIKDKVTRIQSTYTLFEQGIVHLPLNHHLLGEFENEYSMFPTGKHDDLLDATEIALQMSMLGSNPYTSTDSSYDYSSYRTKQNRRR